VRDDDSPRIDEGAVRLSRDADRLLGGPWLLGRPSRGFSRQASEPEVFLLEKLLDTRIVVVNKPGAGSQVGLTEFVSKANPMKLRTSTSGILSPAHVSEVLMLKPKVEEAAKAQ
jgi:hypothetical protein